MGAGQLLLFMLLQQLIFLVFFDDWGTRGLLFHRAWLPAFLLCRMHGCVTLHAAAAPHLDADAALARRQWQDATLAHAVLR